MPITKQPHYSPRVSIDNIIRMEKITGKRLSRNFNDSLEKILDMVESTSQENRLKRIERKIK